MQIGDLVKIIGYAVDVSEVGVIIDHCPAVRNGKRILYHKIMLPDNSFHWLCPEDIEAI
jgi:hypothetical protein